MGEVAGVASVVNAIKACGQSRDLELGRRLHSQAVCSGVDRNKFVANCLVSMYARCGSMADAHRVFEGISAEENVSSGVLLMGYVQRGEAKAALECFSRMNGVDSRGLVAALTACTQLASKESEPDDKLKWFHKGMALHSEALQRGMVDDNVCVQTSLLNLYAKCGKMALARDVFDRMRAYNVVSWTALLHGYVENGDFRVALELYEGIEDGRIACFIPEGNGRVFIAGLLACTNLAALAADAVVDDKNGIQSQSSKSLWLEKGKAIHSQAMMYGCNSDQIYVENTLINMYSKCGSLDHARAVFDNMHGRSTASWNVMLQTYVENGKSELVLELFDGAAKEEQGLIFDSRSYVIAIGASAALLAEEQIPETGNQRWLEKAKGIHSQAVRSGCCNLYVETALMELYGRCGKMDHARDIFDSMVEQNTITCCTLLQGYVENGDNELSLEVFEAMDDASWARTNHVSYISALTACANLAEGIKDQQQEAASLNLLEKGKAMHSRAVMAGHHDKKVENTLVSLYGKCGAMVHAQCVFDNLLEQTVVSWNALIMGYVAAEENEAALKLIALMDLAGFALHSSTFVAGLVACKNSVNFEQGLAFHAEACNFGLEQHPGVATALIDFYAKCGSTDSARQVFDSLLFKPVAAWNSMLNGYALQGNTSLAFELFNSMREHKVAPDKITFLYILSACRHAGLIDKGKSYFHLMQEYRICPDEIHRTCMVDLLATGNHMSEALQVLRSMAYEDTRAAWTSVLSACRRWNNVEVGKLAYEALLKLNRHAASTYDLMASVHAGGGS